MITYATDADMAYAAARTPLAPGKGLRLDEAYRLAHLPLIAPGHPDVIAEGNGYRMGMHAPGYSLVLPIDAAALAADANYRALETALRAAPFAAKIAWDILPKRADKLHATICGGLIVEDGQLPDPARERLRQLGVIPFEVRGLFSGNRNIGRLYLAVYPEMREREQAFAGVQRALGREPNAMALIGLFNLTDHLDESETAALAALLARFEHMLFLRGVADRLAVLRSADDLVLNAGFIDFVRLA